MEIPEHPEIDRCLSTGYPNVEERKVITCVDCDKELYGDDAVFIWDGEYLCEECVLERIEENYPIKTIAELLGIAWKSAYLIQEDE